MNDTWSQLQFSLQIHSSSNLQIQIFKGIWKRKTEWPLGQSLSCYYTEKNPVFTEVLFTTKFLACVPLCDNIKFFKNTLSTEPSILKIIIKPSMYFVSVENWSWSRVFHFAAGKKQVAFMELQSISELHVFDSAATYRQKSKVFPTVNLKSNSFS